MPPPTTSDSRLPFELERLIVEIAARRYHRPDMLHLLLVARRFKQWVEPFFYKMVTVRESHSAGLLLRLLEERPDVGRYVKSLCITANELDSAPLILSLVDACPSAENLALWNHNDSSLVLDRIAYQPLRRLSLMSSHFTVHSDPKRIFGERAFEHITHLDIADIPMMTHWMATRWHFRRVAHLTHLRLRFVYPSDPYLGELLALPILSASPAMQVLLVEHHRAADTIACLATVTRMAADRAFDPRLVLIIDHSDAMRAWEAPVRGRRDAWASGEKHVRLQRSHNCYLLLQIRGRG